MRKILVMIYFISFSLFGQSGLEETAQKHYNDKEWNDAIKVYKKHLKKNKTDSLAWFNLAISEMNTRDYSSAQIHFDKALATNYSKVFVQYNKSKTFAYQENKTQMLEYLGRAAKTGMAGYVRIENEKAFDAYRSEGKFKEIIEIVKGNAHPCLNNEDSRHFDFWLGEWDVYARGGKVGENSITKAHGGCAIHENYITKGAYAGQSINYFDPIDQKWHQHWVGSSGDVYNYVETAREPGMLQFESPFLFQGQKSISRLTFTLLENGDVRQLFESSTDDGKTWTGAFDGIYKKKK